MISIVTVLYQGQDVPVWSQNIFDPSWVDKLYRGIERNITQPFEFICLVDRDYKFQTPIKPIPLIATEGNMFCLLECLRPDLGPHQRLFMGLDTIITGKIDEIASYKGNFAMIRDPYYPERPASGVMSFNPESSSSIWNKFLHDANRGNFKLAGEVSDMIWLGENLPSSEIGILQDSFPNQILSYKCEVRGRESEALEEARIVYFHGVPKPHEMDDMWVQQHWK